MMMQAENGIHYTSGWNCFITIYKKEGGIKGYFPGLSVNVIRGISGAILLIGYDEIKLLIHGS